MSTLLPFAFKHFTKLSSLRIVLNRNLPLKDVFDAINNMKGPMLRELVLDNTHAGDFFVLTSKMINSLNYKNIKLLSMKNTGLITVDPKILYNFPSIQEISLGFNVFYQRTTNYSFSLELFNWVNMYMDIQAIDIDNFSKRVIDSAFHDIYFKNSLDSFPKPPQYVDFPGKSNEHFFIKATDYLKRDGIFIYLPTSLKYFYASRLPPNAVQMPGSSYTVPQNNLMYIDISYSKLFTTVPLFKGLDKLQGINFNNCEINSLHKNQLMFFPQLRYINLARNNLNSKDLGKLFTNVSNLQWLDISYNELDSLPPDLITNLKLLEYASFKGNPLVTVTLDLQSNTNLKLLDISACSLVNLTDTFQHQLDKLQSQLGHNLTLNISNNKFKCSCSTLSMIHWFQSTRVNFIDRETILCKYNDNSTYVADINYEELLKKCVEGKLSLLIIVITPVGLLCFGAVMFVMVYRFKWQLRWCMYKTRKNMRAYAVHKFHGDDLPLVPVQQYDAFISYNHTEDYQWVVDELFTTVEEQWGFKLCLGQKDFVVGKPISENIIDAVENSRKTILVVTPGFAESDWCEFEMQMALVKGRECVVTIYKEEVPVKNMSKTLRWLMRSINYIEYNEDAVGQRMFWDKLRNTLERI